MIVQRIDQLMAVKLDDCTAEVESLKSLRVADAVAGLLYPPARFQEIANERRGAQGNARGGGVSFLCKHTTPPQQSLKVRWTAWQRYAATQRSDIVCKLQCKRKLDTQP